MKFNYIKCSGREIERYLDDLIKLRIEVFREWPYIYDGSEEYEREYLQTYLDTERSLVVFVEYKGKIIGASTCLALADETEEFQQAFLQQDLDINTVFYFGESILKKEFRGQKIGHEFFKLREEFAQKTLPNLKLTCFAAVERPANHPLCPEDYKPLNEFWQRMGYQKNPKTKVQYPWTDVGDSRETTKDLFYWLKSW